MSMMQIREMVVRMGQVLVGVNMNMQCVFVQTKVFMKMMTIGMVVQMDMLRFFVGMVMTVPADS